jgi:hypothetical protein
MVDLRKCRSGLLLATVLAAVLPACSSVVHETYYAPESRLSERRVTDDLYDGVTTSWSGPPIKAPLYSGSVMLQAEVLSHAPRRVTIGPLVLAIIPWFPISWATRPDLATRVDRDGLVIRIGPLTFVEGGDVERVTGRNGQFELDFSQITVQPLDAEGNPLSSERLTPTAVVLGGADYDAFELRPGPWAAPSGDSWFALVTFRPPPVPIDGFELSVGGGSRNGAPIRFLPVRFERVSGWSFALGL